MYQRNNTVWYAESVDTSNDWLRVPEYHTFFINNKINNILYIIKKPNGSVNFLVLWYTPTLPVLSSSFSFLVSRTLFSGQIPFTIFHIVNSYDPLHLCPHFLF